MMKELVTELNEASDAYYNGKDEIMSNKEFDDKIEQLEQLGSVTKFDDLDVFAEVRENWDSRYGDRENQVVFIGKGYNKDTIRMELEKCLD